MEHFEENGFLTLWKMKKSTRSYPICNQLKPMGAIRSRIDFQGDISPVAGGGVFTYFGGIVSRQFVLKLRGRIARMELWDEVYWNPLENLLRNGRQIFFFFRRKYAFV